MLRRYNTKELTSHVINSTIYFNKNHIHFYPLFNSSLYRNKALAQSPPMTKKDQ